jgi:hypothetical protein
LIQGLQTYSLPLEDVVPLFAALLSVPLNDRYPMPTLTSQQQKQQTVDTLVAWLVEVAEQQPILDTLQDSLMARLDQMNTAKELVQLGAVLGREFSYEMMQMVSSQDDATV